MKSVIIHDDIDDDDDELSINESEINQQNQIDKQKIEQQKEIINNLTKQIEILQKDNSDKKQLIDIADKKEKKQEELMIEMENTLTEYKKRAQTAEDKINELNNKCEWYDRKSRSDEAIRKKLHNEIQELKGNVRVFCRVRPLISSELGG
eukprot:711546_1